MKKNSSKIKAIILLCDQHENTHFEHHLPQMIRKTLTATQIGRLLDMLSSGNFVVVDAAAQHPLAKQPDPNIHTNGREFLLDSIQGGNIFNLKFTNIPAVEFHRINLHKIQLKNKNKYSQSGGTFENSMSEPITNKT